MTKLTPSTVAARSEHVESIRSWEQTAPWFRRASARLGLQGKLTISFMFLLAVALGGSGWYFLRESRDTTREVVRQQVVLVSHTLAMSSEKLLAEQNCTELTRVGRDLLRDRGILAAAFYDAEGKLLTAASRDPDLAWPDVDPATWASQPRRLPVVVARETAAWGRFMEVTAPVMSIGNRRDDLGARVPAGLPVGYVTMCFAPAVGHPAPLARVGQMILLIGAAASLVSFPLVYGLVHRIFLPIRELVEATDRITAGDMNSQVAIHRPDIIGTLARSFNEMTIRVRDQQEQLEAANAMLADANNELEQKVQERTAQLEAANRRLKNEIAEKEDFLRAVSHDLNAPLRNISGMATMLLMKHRERFDEDIIHRLERIQKNVEVETDLISELLELSRIRTHRQQTEPVDVGALVGELAGVFENDLRTRQISLVIDTPLPTLDCERARMRQVFQNLIDNAIKYMGGGSSEVGVQSSESNTGPNPSELRTPNCPKEIHVGCTVRADEAEFYVRDTGIGIEPEDLDKVFFVFRRGKAAAAQGISGKGVGLASVKSIVETYQGTIWVESRVGQGSTFRFTINGRFLVRPPYGQGRAA